jgi:ABC-type sugar transport system, periplasmic component
MNKSHAQKLIAIFMVIAMMFGALSVIPVSAADSAATDTADASGNDSSATATDDESSQASEAESEIYGTSNRTLSEIEDLIDTISYTEYDEKYADVAKANQTITIDAADYDASQTTADVEVLTDYSGSTGSSLQMGPSGNTVWNVNIPETGRYAMRITYIPVVGDTVTTIERMLYIDGKLPFSEARYFYFPRSWEYITQEDGSFDYDIAGNDIRPIRKQNPVWNTYYLRDWLGYSIDPFEFYFSQGEHTITFVGAREPIVISKIELYRYDEEMSYEDYIASYKAQGATEVTGVDTIKIQGEAPTLVSNACLYPTNDRTSALTEPQDPTVIKYNLLNSSVVGQWMRYKVTVPKSGFYNIVTRFRQNSLIGMFTSRRIRINGVIPFREASYCRFKYSADWQSLPLNNGNTNFMFYLEEGENTIEFEVVLGDMVSYVYRIGQMIINLNAAYQEMIMLTGPTPDAYRDYGFTRVTPDAVRTIGASAQELFDIAKELSDITGELGDQVATLNTIGLLFQTMAEDEYEIAPNFVTFKNYIVALSNWLYASLDQPLKLDYFTVQGTDTAIPQAKANFFQAAWFEIKAFVMSFTMDYTSIGYRSDPDVEITDSIEMWIVSALGRDDALIVRYLIDNYFTPDSHISVNIKVVSAGLTEAILAGIGPDVANMSSTDTVTWGLREAVTPLNDMPGFDEVKTWFDDAALTPLTMTNSAGENLTYGLPTVMAFYMMFYRLDVLAELGLDIPTTWDDLYDILPVLQNKHMVIGLPTSLTGTNIFLYQLGGSLYADDGKRINLDSNVGLKAFELLTDMFVKYSCPVVYDISWFRTGQMPIVIADAIGTYNTLMGYSELRGLWEMAPLLGFQQEDGSINVTSPTVVTSIVIPKGAQNPQSTWEYMKWYTSEDAQIRLAKEQLNVAANPTTKYNTANVNALLSLAWTDQEYTAVSTQLKNLVGIPEYPGSYIVPVYVDNAFMEVYNSKTNAINSMLDRILDINKEISRKRKEFKMDYLPISYSGSYVEGDTSANGASD